MSEMPEDVMKAANEQADKFFPLTGSPVSIIANEALSDAIAAAVLAERERCAQIAEEHHYSVSQWGRRNDALLLGNIRAAEIAAAIRGKP